MKHIARKRFGQHFLSDQATIDALVRAINPSARDRMVEIGPGLAALTQPLVERLGHLTVIELDRDLAQRLRDHPHLTVVESDVLKVAFDDLPVPRASVTTAPSSTSAPSASDVQQKLRVVGNLPYNISTPILFHLLAYVDGIEDQHFMLQKEVVDRMVAAPASADYGRLTVMLQWRYAMESVLAVPPECFDPPPRVHSAVVRMVPRPAPQGLSADLLGELVRVAFGQRRKLLRHTLGRWLEEKNYAGNFNLHRRAEEVSVEDYVALAREVGAAASTHVQPAA
jgi:16S rRNA (adenine1518-N6/adenine1519-N6)-dimethyltransferase